MTKQERKLQILEELWFRQVVTKLKKHQQPIFDTIQKVIKGELDTRSYVVLCARRFGKTFTLLLIACLFAWQHPNSEIQYVGPAQNQLIRAVKKSFQIIVEGCPEHIKPEFLSNNTIRFSNDSTIYFAGTDMNPDGVRGSGSNLNIVEEAAFVNNLEYVYKSNLLKLARNARAPTIFVTTPPVTPDHDFTKIYREHAELGLVTKFTIFDSDLSPEQIEEEIRLAGGIESTTVRREDLCEFVTDSDLRIIREWNDIYEQEIPLPDYYPYFHKYMSIDPGVSHLTAVLFGYYNFIDAKLVIEDEVTMNGPDMTTETIAKEIKIIRDRLWTKDVKVYRHIADNNNKQLINDLGPLYQLPFKGTTKKDLDGMVNKVRVFIGQGKLIVHPRCKQLLGCLNYGVWNSKADIGKKFGESKTYGHYDALAALVYLIRNLDIHTNPIPVNLHFNPIKHLWPQPDNSQQQVWQQVYKYNNKRYR